MRILTNKIYKLLFVFISLAFLVITCEKDEEEVVITNFVWEGPYYYHYMFEITRDVIDFKVWVTKSSFQYEDTIFAMTPEDGKVYYYVNDIFLGLIQIDNYVIDNPSTGPGSGKPIITMIYSDGKEIRYEHIDMWEDISIISNFVYEKMEK